MIGYMFERKNRFLTELLQAKVVDGIHGTSYMHSARYRIGGLRFPLQTRWSNRGVKGVLLLWCLSSLLLFWSFAGQMEAGVVLMRSRVLLLTCAPCC